MSEFRLLLAQLLLLVPLSITTWFAVEYFLYWRIWWLDIPMHFLGGFWVGLAAIYLLSKYEISKYKCFFAVMFIVFIIGLSWEVFEFTLDTLITFKKQNSLDSSSDMFFDLAGGVVSYLYIYWKNLV